MAPIFTVVPVIIAHLADNTHHALPNCQDRCANGARKLEARHKSGCQILEDQNRKGTGAVFSHVMVFPHQNCIRDFYHILGRSSALIIHLADNCSPSLPVHANLRPAR